MVKKKKNEPTNNLDLAIANLRKEFGDDVIMVGRNSVYKKVDVIDSGSLAINSATGIDGYPRGRIVEIFGPESSGKTTLALHAIAEAQKAGNVAAFIDVEHALDTKYAENIGVDIDKVLFSQPDYGEQAITVALTLAKSGAVDIIVVDSVAALVPKKEIDGEIDSHDVGGIARLMSKSMRMLKGIASKTNTLVIFINQLREKIGISFGTPETTTGGRALKFYASMRIDIRRIGKSKYLPDDGNRVKVKIVKNKLASPFKQAEFDVIFGRGAYQTSSILDFALEYDIVEKKGSWFNYPCSEGEIRLGQGFGAAIEFLDDNRELCDEIYKSVSMKINENKQFVDESDYEESIRDEDKEDDNDLESEVVEENG